MPYISVHTSLALSEPEKDTLKSALGQAILVLPGKEEAGLMIEITDQCCLYYGGKKGKIAYVDVKALGTPAEADQKAFLEAVSKVLVDTGCDKDKIYITFVGLPHWGLNGTMI